MEAMEREICEVIAKHTPFSPSDVYQAWKGYKSFDLLMRGIKVARLFGFSSIFQAINFMAAEYLSGRTKDAPDLRESAASDSESKPAPSG